MAILLTTLHVLVCLILILVILLQVGRGHGLTGASFGDSGIQSIFGTKTGDILSKMTSAAAIIFVLTTITLDVFQANKSRSLFRTQGKELQGIDMEKMKDALEKIKVEAQAKEAQARQVTTALKEKQAREDATKASTQAAAALKQSKPSESAKK